MLQSSSPPQDNGLSSTITGSVIQATLVCRQSVNGLTPANLLMNSALLIACKRLFVLDVCMFDNGVLPATLHSSNVQIPLASCASPD